MTHCVIQCDFQKNEIKKALLKSIIYSDKTEESLYLTNISYNVEVQLQVLYLYLFATEILIIRKIFTNI